MKTIASVSRMQHHPIAEEPKAAKAGKTPDRQDAPAHGVRAAANTAHDKDSFINAMPLAEALILSQLSRQSQNNGAKASAQAKLTQKKAVEMLGDDKIVKKLDHNGNHVISKREINQARAKILKKLDDNGVRDPTFAKKVIEICNALVPPDENAKKGKEVSKLFHTLAKADGNNNTISTQDLELAKLAKIAAVNDPPDPPEGWDPTTGDYSFVVVPDPQAMIGYDAKHGTKFGEMLGKSIAAYKDAEDIRFVMSVGDNVNNGRKEKSWEAVKRMYAPLSNAGIPLITVPGNHDYTDFKINNKVNENPSNLTDYYNHSHLLGKHPKTLAAFKNSANALYQPKTGGEDSPLILALEPKPNQEVIDWANDVLNDPKYKDRDVIILTHAYLNKKGELNKKEGADDLYNNLVSKHPNIRMVFAGHTAVGTEMPHNVTQTALGNYVSSFLADAQNADKQALEQGNLPLGMVVRVRMSSNGENAQLIYYSTVQKRYYGFMEVNPKTGEVIKLYQKL